jgi:hypothetical protein
MGLTVRVRLSAAVNSGKSVCVCVCVCVCMCRTCSMCVRERIIMSVLDAERHAHVVEAGRQHDVCFGGGWGLFEAHFEK